MSDETLAKTAVLALRPRAIASKNEKPEDWAIFDGHPYGEFLGYGTHEDDAWRDAQARLQEVRSDG